MRHQAQAVALGSGPAQHRVALLRFQVGPAHAEGFGPVIEIVKGVVDVITRPDRIDGRTSPFDPVVEGEVGRVMDASGLLHGRADDQAAASGDDGRSARLGVFLERNGARSGLPRLDAGRNAGGAGANQCDSVWYCMTLFIRAGRRSPPLVRLNSGSNRTRTRMMITNDPDQSNTAVSVAVPIAAKAAAEPTKQKDDKNNEQDRSKRHGFPFFGLAVLPKLSSNARCANG